jgi:peroxiredoxin
MNEPRRPASLGLGPILFIAVLFLAGTALLGWSAARYWGWLPTTPTGPDLARQAKDYLRSKNVVPLSAAMEKLLADAAGSHQKTDPHPLLGQRAPDFDLVDVDDKHVRLSEVVDKGSVVLVFYYGYFCNHCVAQLFGIDADLAKFRELGAQVVAISADPPEQTRAKFKQYGPFGFAVLSDPGNKTAQAFGVFRPKTDKTPERQDHATFVIDRSGVVRWAQQGDEPFTDDRTLLYEVAAAEGRVTPSTEK